MLNQPKIMFIQSEILSFNMCPVAALRLIRPTYELKHTEHEAKKKKQIIINIWFY